MVSSSSCPHYSIRLITASNSHSALLPPPLCPLPRACSAILLETTLHHLTLRARLKASEGQVHTSAPRPSYKYSNTELVVKSNSNTKPDLDRPSRSLNLRSRLSRQKARPDSLPPFLYRQNLSNMGVTKHTLKPGNGTDIPQKGDDVVIEYTGFLYDESAPDHKGKQ